jgi:hypothetical protein
LLCELYLHEHACQLDKRFNMTPFVGHIQLRAFTSFFNNQVTWLNGFQTVHTNEGSSTLWIISELQSSISSITTHQKFLSSLERLNSIEALHKKVIE